VSAKSCVRREPLTEIVYDRAAETAAVYEIEDALNLESINPKCAGSSSCALSKV